MILSNQSCDKMKEEMQSRYLQCQPAERATLHSQLKVLISWHPSIRTAILVETSPRLLPYQEDIMEAL